MAWLQVDKGRLQGKIIQLGRDELLLGREKEWVDEVISTKDIVSRKHAKILIVKEAYCIEDLGSRNATYVNGQMIPKNTPVPLKHNDRINICEDEFEAVFLDGTEENSSKSSSTVEAMVSSSSEHSLEAQPAVKLARLLAITARLSKTLQLDTQLPLVADGLLELFTQADRCFIILVEEETGSLMPKVIRTHSKIDATAARFSHTIVRQCLSKSSLILIAEGDPIPPGSESVIISNMRSVMCVPLCPAEGGAVRRDSA